MSESPPASSSLANPIEAGGRQSVTVIGETPNLAARLQAVAGAGEVVIAEHAPAGRADVRVPRTGD